MRPSDEKIRALVHRAVGALSRDRTVRVVDAEAARKVLSRAVEEVLSLDDQIDAAACAKIDSLSRRVPAGTREWSELHAKYVAEERRRRGL